MRRRDCVAVLRLVGLVAAGGLLSGVALGQGGESTGEAALRELLKQKGPGKAQLADIAAINLPRGYRFADAENTRKFLEALENPTSDTEIGLVMPDGDDWFVVYEFDDVGYVKDDDRDKLDPDALLKSIKEGNAEGNKERKKRGWSTIEVIGWELPPHYDPVTNNLVWATRAISDSQESINYNTRRLGRHGVMRITLVAAPDELKQAVPKFDQLMTGFSFTSGNRYGDWKAGDKVAKYGLTALVAGGAAAVAVKTGLFKWIWKAGIFVVIAIGAVFKKIFGRRQTA